MADRATLVAYLDDYLQIAIIKDYGPQGLQVEARAPTVERLALAVDSAPAVIDAAAQWGAQMLLVHHGVLWGPTGRIAGPLGERVRRLLANDMHLYAAHLPLDCHPEVGNNITLARLLNVAVDDWWCAPQGTPLAVVGNLPAPMPRHQLLDQVNTLLHTEARLLPHGPAEARRVAILSGGGADYVEQAAATGADTYVTGETSHAHFWAAADAGLNVVFAGHYATETVGVQALGRHLAERFDVATHFFDFPTQM